MSTRALHEDGVRLANAIGRRGGDRPFVLGIPRGGVALADAVAHSLTAPLDVMVAARLRAPDGAPVAGIAEGGAMVVDDDALAALHLTIGDLDPLVEEERRALEVRGERLHGSWPVPALAGRTVVVVDDVLITGLTMRAAVAAVLARRAGDVVVATPLCSAEARAALALAGHEVVALEVAPAAEVAERHARRGGLRPPTDREIHLMVVRALRDAGVDPFAGGR